MSRAENRHHRQRVIRNRIRKIKHKWSISYKCGSEEWLQKTAHGKDNPFTRCSCFMCQNAEQEHIENKRERKAAKQAIKLEESEDEE